MARQFYKLPPMTMLLAFEAAARRGSFKTAAQELNVTPGAVSHQIKALEAELVTALFDRVHRGVILTSEGEALCGALQKSLTAMSHAVEAARGLPGDRAVSIGATTAVSALWLTPRITRFWRDHPNVRVNQVLSDSRTAETHAPDLRIYYGPTKSDGGSTPLFNDVLTPLAAPGYAAANPVTGLADIARMSLIHLNADDPNWTTWKSWFAHLGYEGQIGRGLEVNNYMIALQAAQDGVGAVLGWQRLVKPFLDNGSLVPIGDFDTPAPAQFYISRTAAASDPNVTLLADWLSSEANRLG